MLRIVWNSRSVPLLKFKFGLSFCWWSSTLVLWLVKFKQKYNIFGDITMNNCISYDEWCHLIVTSQYTFCAISLRPEFLNHNKYIVAGGGKLMGMGGQMVRLTVCCSHCHCSHQSVMAIGQSWLADDDG